MVLVSHKYQFIYIKNVKVAGTSVESFFQRYCVENEDSYEYKHKSDSVITKYGIIGNREGGNITRFYNHISISEIKQILPTCYEKYFKFCVVRNPFDQVVSQYYMRVNRNGQNITFEEYIKSLQNSLNWNRMCIGGKPALNYYIRYENLKEDIENVLNHLEITNYNLDDLPKYKSEFRGNKNYKDLFTSELREIVE